MTLIESQNTFRIIKFWNFRCVIWIQHHMIRIKWNKGFQETFDVVMIWLTLFMTQITEFLDSNHFAPDSNLEVMKIPGFTSDLLDLNHIVHDLNLDFSLHLNHIVHDPNHINGFTICFIYWFKFLFHLTQIIYVIITRIKHHFLLIFVHNSKHLDKSLPISLTIKI